MLIVGAKLGDELLTSTWLSDPDGPETLDVYFDEWVATARARLLLDYARATLGREAAPDYSGWPATQAAAQRSRDAADAARIARIASEGNYGQAWAPFVEAYRSFQADALDEVPEGAPTPELAEKVTQIAERHGLPRLIAELHIEPQHVAEEILRLVGEWIAKSGGPEGKLFYACDGEVRFRVEHPLGPTLMDALAAGPQDPITATFSRLQESFAAWWKEHPQADQLEADEYLRRTAEDVGVMTSLAKAEKEERAASPALP